MSNSFPMDLPAHLPDLNDDSGGIIGENLMAARALYFAAMLEQMKVFDVVDRIVKSFLNGQLPIRQGRAGERLYKHFRNASLRLSAKERAAVYRRTFGFAGGEGDVTPNREFAGLWTRFLAAVVEFRDLRERTNEVREAGLNLARNLSQHAEGAAHYAARDLQAQIQEMLAILREPEIQSAYGARDLWVVVERVSQIDLGGASVVVRYRTMAVSGAGIILWLTNHRNQLATGLSSTGQEIGHELRDACAAWLAVAGTSAAATT
jgi:hypothetical protein